MWEWVNKHTCLILKQIYFHQNWNTYCINSTDFSGKYKTKGVVSEQTQQSVVLHKQGEFGIFAMQPNYWLFNGTGFVLYKTKSLLELLR